MFLTGQHFRDVWGQSICHQHGSSLMTVSLNTELGLCLPEFSSGRWLFFTLFLLYPLEARQKLWPAFNEWAAELHYLEGRSFSIIYLEFFYMGYFYLLLQLFIQSLACLLSCSVVSDSLWPYELQPARLLSPWDFSGRNTGVGCHALLQGIFPTQGSNSWFQFHLACR